MNKTLKLKHQINSSLPKINVMYSNEDFSNKMKDSLASSVGVRNLGLARESLQIKTF